MDGGDIVALRLQDLDGPKLSQSEMARGKRGLMRALSRIQISDSVAGTQFMVYFSKVSYQLLFRVVGGGSAVNIIPINGTARQYSTYWLLT